jgi:hypothetical protein
MDLVCAILFLFFSNMLRIGDRVGCLHVKNPFVMQPRHRLRDLRPALH